MSFLSFSDHFKMLLGLSGALIDLFVKDFLKECTAAVPLVHAKKSIRVSVVME